MPDWGWWLIGAAAALGLGALLFRRPLERIAEEILLERAREMFSLQRDHLAEQFLESAAATGKPRGLRWTKCDFEDGVFFARDQATHEIHALVGATIGFEAIEGSDMEGVEAVQNLRSATAVFVFRSGQWRSSGRALFNMNPNEALEHFKEQLAPIHGK
jgi:hypothetical protein